MNEVFFFHTFYLFFRVGGCNVIYIKGENVLTAKLLSSMCIMETNTQTHRPRKRKRPCRDLIMGFFPSKGIPCILSLILLPISHTDSVSTLCFFLITL